MADVAVRIGPIGPAIARILRNGPVGAAIAADIVEPMRPCPIAQEIEPVAESLFEARLHRRKEGISRTLEPGDPRNAGKSAAVRPPRIHCARPRDREG